MWPSVLVYCGILAIIKGVKIQPPVSKCIKHAAPLPLAAEVEGCTDHPPPCVLSQGGKAHVSIAFRAPRYMPTIVTRISTFQHFRGVFYEMPVDLEGDGDQTCRFLWDAECPAHKGDLIMYPLEWTVHEPTFDPGEAAAVEIGNVDDKGIVMCLRIEFIVGPSKSQPFPYLYNKRWKNYLIRRLYYGD